MQAIDQKSPFAEARAPLKETNTKESKAATGPEVMQHVFHKISA